MDDISNPLDPTEIDPVPVPPDWVSSGNTLTMGFRTEWLTGQSGEDATSFSLTAGAGVGSPWLILDLHVPTEDGQRMERRVEAIDMTKFAQAWVKEARARLYKSRTALI